MLTVQWNQIFHASFPVLIEKSSAVVEFCFFFLQQKHVFICLGIKNPVFWTVHKRIMAENSRKRKMNAEMTEMEFTVQKLVRVDLRSAFYFVYIRCSTAPSFLTNFVLFKPLNFQVILKSHWKTCLFYTDSHSYVSSNVGARNEQRSIPNLQSKLINICAFGTLTFYHHFKLNLKDSCRLGPLLCSSRTKISILR